MTYQRNATPEPLAGDFHPDAALPVGWRALDDQLPDGGIPPYDEDLRVLVYTADSSFAGEQVFDMKAIDFYDDEPDEVIEHATHWSVRPAPDRAHADDLAVDQFAAMMKAKLAKSRAKGRAGWQAASAGMLSAMLREHVEKGDPLDVAIFSMMLTLIGGEIKPAEAANDPRAAGEDPAPTADDLAAVVRPFLALRVRDDMKRPDCTCGTCWPSDPINDPPSYRMVLCATCGNKRCPHAADHRHACTNSNEPGQPGSSYAHVRPLATIAEIAKARL